LNLTIAIIARRQATTSAVSGSPSTTTPTQSHSDGKPTPIKITAAAARGHQTLDNPLDPPSRELLLVLPLVSSSAGLVRFPIHVAICSLLVATVEGFDEFSSLR